MITIKALINKIKWDSKENPDQYSLYYLDRVENKYKEIKYNEILKVEGNFLIIIRDDEETNIPLHRIKIVKKKGMTIWKR